MNRVLSSALLLITASLSLVACSRQSNEPRLVVFNGKAVSTENCGKAVGHDQILCRGYECEISLHDKKVMPPYSATQEWRRTHSVSDPPNWSVHMVKYVHDGKTRFAKCEMEGNTVVTASEVSEQEFLQ